MAFGTVHWRLRIRNQADSADLLVLSSVPGGTNPYLTAEPKGDGQSIDPITGHQTIGRYVWRAWDNKESATEYTITKVLADALARNQMLSNRCFGEYSTNVGSSWLPLHTGHLNRQRLITAGEWEFTIGDTDRREQDTEVFRYVDREAGLFPKVSCIIGGPIPGGFGFGRGLQLDFGTVRFKVIADPATLVTDNRVTLRLVSGYLRPYYDVLRTSFQEDEKNTINRLAKQWFEYDPVTFATTVPELSQPWGWFPGLTVEMQPVGGGTTRYVAPIAKEAPKRTTGDPGPTGEYDALVNGADPRLIVRWDDTVFGAGLTPAQPALNTEFDVLVYAKEISSESPLQITGHPCDILATLLTENGIPYDVASLTATRAAVGDELRLELVVEGPEKLAQWLESKILGPWGIGLRIKADGEREIFHTRGTPPAVVDTVTVDDLVTEDGGPPDDVIFNVDEKSTINGVDYRMRTFRRFLNPSYESVQGHKIKVAGDDIDQQTINLLTYGKFTIEGRRAATAVQGDRVLLFDIPGQLLFLNAALNAYTAVRVTEYALAAGDVIIDRAGWGVIEGEIRVHPSIAGLPGDYLDLQVPHQVNAKTAFTPKAKRGDTRKVQIIKRTDEVSASLLTVWDAGNLSQVPPTDDGTTVDPGTGALTVPAFTLAPQSVAPITGGVPDPDHVATATLTNGGVVGAEGAAVHFEYLVQAGTPAGSDSGLVLGVLQQPDVVDEIDTPPIDPSGQTVWVRAQSRMAATGQVSAWSAWQSITLGPEQTGNDVMAPALSFTIDTAGLADILASVAGNVIKVKFAAAAVGAAEASDATVRAATADSVPPFEALNIFTLLPGEQRAVSAFAYDQFDNESAKVTVMVRHTAVPMPSLTYSIDGAGLVDILANVGPTVVSVKFAAASVGAAEATDAAVRAATADTVAPFESLDIFTLAVGVSRAVSAFAYDAAGNESPKATVVVTRGTSTGQSVGFAFDHFTVGEFVLRPLPFGGTFSKWWAKRESSGDATWLVEYASSVTGSFASVGGTQPSVTGAIGSKDDDGLDWTTVTFVEGGVLKVTLVTYTGATVVAAITIGATRA